MGSKLLSKTNREGQVTKMVTTTKMPQNNEQNNGFAHAFCEMTNFEVKDDLFETQLTLVLISHTG